MPRVRHVLIVTFLFVFVFAIIGIQSFGGAMARCTDSTITLQSACTGYFNVTGELCAYLPTLAEETACRASPTGALFPRLWQTFYTQAAYAGESFDDMPRSLLVVFELVTGENWPVC